MTPADAGAINDAGAMELTLVFDVYLKK